MDNFEALVRLLLEQEGYWTRQSHKVNLTPDEKAEIGRPTMPRPEIDIIAFKPEKNEIIAMEVKSYLDSAGVPSSVVRPNSENPSAPPKGSFKLFTSENYKKIVFTRLKEDLRSEGLAYENTTVKLGLAAGKVNKDRQEALVEQGNKYGWIIWTPAMIAEKTRALATVGYENDPFVITAKLLERNS